MNRYIFEKVCNKPTNKNLQSHAHPPTTNPLLHENKSSPTSSPDTDIAHQPCPSSGINFYSGK